MTTKAYYKHLEHPAHERSRQLFIRGTGIRCSTIWHDRYVSLRNPADIAKDRQISLAAVYEALDYCQENWESIMDEKEVERRYLEERGFFSRSPLEKST